MKRAVRAVIYTICAGLLGLWMGAIVGVPTAGAVVCAVAVMGGFIIYEMNEV